MPGINWGDDLVTREEQEGIEEHMGVSQWAMAKSLRRLEKYLRSTHCQTLAGVLREIPCDILFEINGLVPFENLHNFFDSLHGPNPRVVKLLSLQEQKALATRGGLRAPTESKGGEKGEAKRGVGGSYFRAALSCHCRPAWEDSSCGLLWTAVA